MALDIEPLMKMLMCLSLEPISLVGGNRSEPYCAEWGGGTYGAMPFGYCALRF
jgi:hypothetical protein